MSLSSSARHYALAGIAAITTAAPFFSTAQAQMSPSMRMQAMALMQLCRSDYDRFCSDVQMGGGRVLACLQSHARDLSPACASGMGEAKALKDKAAAAGSLPK